MKVELTTKEVEVLLDTISLALSLSEHKYFLTHKKTLLGLAFMLSKEYKNDKEPISCAEFVDKINTGECK